MTTADVPTKWLTLKEAAEYARCSTVTLTREIRAEHLRAYRLASRRSFRLQRTDIDRWIAGGSGNEPIPYVLPRAAGERS
jgi:excisionase family DNA binding protein